MFWPFNPNESDKVKAAADNFSSLTLEQKHMWVAAAMCIGQTYRLRYVKIARWQKKKRKPEDNYTWASYLKVKELVMMGDMDYVEAKNVFKKTIKVRRPIYSFEDRLRKKYNEQYDEYCNKKNPSSYYYYGEDKYDEEIDKMKKGCSEEKRCILDPKERENMLANVESYRIKMERAMNLMRKKMESDEGACSETKCNQSDEGACSETKFNQSDEGACSETKCNQADEGACSETKFNQSERYLKKNQKKMTKKKNQKKMAKKENRMMKKTQFNQMKQLFQKQDSERYAKKMAKKIKKQLE